RQPATGDIQGDVGLAGSVVTSGNGLYLGRPVTDGFAVVTVDEADGLDSVPIKHNNALIGKIDPGSSLVVPGVLSHQENELSIYSGELPIDFFSLDDKKYVEVGNRGGASLTFTVTRFTAVEGNVYLAEDGEKKELSSLPIEFVVTKEKQTGFIGINGYFYIEHLPIGEHMVRVLRFEGDCEARFIVTESEDIVANLGKIACVPVDKEK
ncbi:MAG: hypothetical protein D3908_14205, partial [Candidatus Electrothrix sp. AUS4]|nr:hypothetical protein [Candidatus Electrothrix sp. AUS4]